MNISKKVGTVKVWHIVIIVLLILVTPLIINILLFLPFPKTPPDLGNKEWLSFWGSFLGGSLGGIATLIAVYSTLKQNKDNHEQLIYDQNKRDSLKLMPFINVIALRNEGKNINLFENIDKEFIQNKKEDSKEDFYQFPSGNIIFSEKEPYYSASIPPDVKEELKTVAKSGKVGHGYIRVIKYQMQLLSFTNIGLGSAINVRINLLDKHDKPLSSNIMSSSFHLGKEQCVILNLIFLDNFKDGEYRLELMFKNMFKSNNILYKQTLNFIINRKKCEEKQIFNITGISAPDEV